MENLELNIIIIKMKNSLEGLRSRSELAGERTSKFEHRLIEIMHFGKQEGKQEWREMKSLREMWNPLVVSASTYIYWEYQKEREKERTERMFE